MSNSKKIAKTDSTKTIAGQLEEFEQLVAWFDSEDFELEAALQQYAKAEELAAQIEAQLSTVKNEVELIKQKFSG